MPNVVLIASQGLVIGASMTCDSTAASTMARLGIALHVIAKVLNHQSGQISGIAKVYNRFEYIDERKTTL